MTPMSTVSQKMKSAHRSDADGELRPRVAISRHIIATAIQFFCIELFLLLGFLVPGHDASLTLLRAFEVVVQAQGCVVII